MKRRIVDLVAALGELLEAWQALLPHRASQMIEGFGLSADPILGRYLDQRPPQSVEVSSMEQVLERDLGIRRQPRSWVWSNFHTLATTGCVEGQCYHFCCGTRCPLPSVAPQLAVAPDTSEFEFTIPVGEELDTVAEAVCVIDGEPCRGANELARAHGLPFDAYLQEGFVVGNFLPSLRVVGEEAAASTPIKALHEEAPHHSADNCTHTVNWKKPMLVPICVQGHCYLPESRQDLGDGTNDALGLAWRPILGAFAEVQ
mmetsp:Transcript_1672/g.3666  ORF Transcript_1672/g.3666 Transcript_1672/m.3666 type:complete len:258 (+) Transcript_1672:1057-1830(+)